MGTMQGIVVGWRARSNRTWYREDGIWTPCSSNIPSVYCVASSPTTDSGAQSQNMFCTCIKITTPTDESIGVITSIKIGFCANDQNNTQGYLYGSLRTVDPDHGSSANDTLNTYRTYVAGGSSEQSIYGISNGFTAESMKYSMTFNGTFDQGTSYYLYLYTKSVSDIYNINAYSSGYYCEIEYAKICNVIFSAGAGSGVVPSSISCCEGEYITIGNQLPTPPANSNIITSYFNITAYNGSIKFGTHKAQKNTYTKYSFKNWTGGGKTVTPGDSIKITEDIVLTAQYTSTQIEEYSDNTISDIKNTLGIPSKSYIASNIPVTLDANTNGGISTISVVNAKRDGEYIFSGWNTDSSLSTTLPNTYAFKISSSIHAIYNLNTYIHPIILPTSDNVYKPSKKIVGFIITLDAGSGTVSSQSITAYKIKSYKFLGWAIASSSDTYITSYIPTSNNDTLYAIFDEGTEIDQPVILPTPVRENYAFLGWTDTLNGTNYVDTMFMPKSNITLYANYKPSKSVEMYIYSNGNWRRATGYLCALDSIFNKCVDA